MEQQAGKPYPEDIVKKAVKEVEEFCTILTQEGVTVRRPDVVDWSKEYQTPHFSSTGRYCMYLYCTISIFQNNSFICL